VFSIVACICVQTIQAILPSSESACTNELSKLRTDATKFFAKFQPKYNTALVDLEAIQGAMDGLGYALNSFVEINYGADFPLDQLQCIIKEFVDIIPVQRNETGIQITHLEDELDLFLDMSNDFKLRHNVICRRNVRSGCETDLNQLRCELSKFFKEVAQAAELGVIVDLWGIEDASNELGYVDRKFKSKYRLVCDSDPQPDPQPCSSIKTDTTNLRKDLKYFYGQAKRPYDAASVLLKDLTDIFTDLTAQIGVTLGLLN